ncbi:alpha/beta fold hydrolase [Pseudomonas sp. L-22-4S-12]|uniref:alpha/beta fold hydrolase n=1 Tax=Pseudomonas sp. L-22-4S-12 TaxID=2610893 RepID=UPI001323B194|nr:alpha/beta fold hydrolase [Pseudomonas sp. L-22-4S-12]MWV16683.1 alpha/beta fold hydrolase [Pseudomonas sp. L-22-4S-12]
MTFSVEETRFSLPHVELAAHLFGPEDGIPVIALHGWLDNAMTYARLAPRLQGLRIVALDFPGHGHSGHYAANSSYSMWEYLEDVLLVAEQLGWQRFSLMGHSLGGIISTLLAAAVPERIERIALIDGLIPYTGEADGAAKRLGDALRARLAVRDKRKPVYPTLERAVQARMQGVVAVSREAAELLAQRGLEPVQGGYTWRTDIRLTLPSLMRLTFAHVEQFVRSVQCPVSLVLAEQGHMAVEPRIAGLIEGSQFEVHKLPGGHHLHLNDEACAQQVADCFNRFFAVT